jgi:hypothetical protein
MDWDCCCSKDGTTQSNIETAPFLAVNENEKPSKKIGWNVAAPGSSTGSLNEESIPSPDLPGGRSSPDHPILRDFDEEEENGNGHIGDSKVIFRLSELKPGLDTPTSPLLDLHYTASKEAPRHLELDMLAKPSQKKTKKVDEANAERKTFAALFVTKTMNFTKVFLSRGDSMLEEGRNDAAVEPDDKSAPVKQATARLDDSSNSQKQRSRSGCCFPFASRSKRTQAITNGNSAEAEEFNGGNQLHDAYFWKLNEPVIKDESKWKVYTHWTRQKFYLQTNSNNSNELGLLYESGSHMSLACRLRDSKRQAVSELDFKKPLDMSADDKQPKKLHPIQILRKPDKQPVLVIAAESSDELANFKKALQGEGFDLS